MAIFRLGAPAVVLVLMCVSPGGALKDDLAPRKRAAPATAAFAGSVTGFLSPSASGLKPHLCGLAAQFHGANMEMRTRHPALRSSACRSHLPVAVPMGRLQLRSRASRYVRTGPLSMTENAQVEPKSPEEIMELNSKLWSAAEVGDAQLIRKLVEDGADVNSAPFVADEEDDDDDGDYSSSPPSELSIESSMPEATVSSDGTVEQPQVSKSLRPTPPGSNSGRKPRKGKRSQGGTV